MTEQVSGLLLVHPDNEFQAFITDLVRAIGVPFDITVSTTAQQALQHVHTHACDVLMVHESAAPDGWEKIATDARSLMPRVATVVVSSGVSTSLLHALAAHPGWTDVIEVPVDGSEARTAILAAATAARDRHKPIGRQSVTEVAEFLALEGRSGVVRARWALGAGTLTFEMGRFVHASIGRLSGLEAIRTMLSLGDGIFL